MAMDQILEMRRETNRAATKRVSVARNVKPMRLKVFCAGVRREIILPIREYLNSRPQEAAVI